MLLNASPITPLPPPHPLPQAAPLGFLVEKAGGLTSDGVSGGSVLDVPIVGIDQRTPLCLGSADEVHRFNDMVLHK